MWWQMKNNSSYTWGKKFPPCTGTVGGVWWWWRLVVMWGFLWTVRTVTGQPWRVICWLGACLLSVLVNCVGSCPSRVYIHKSMAFNHVLKIVPDFFHLAWALSWDLFLVLDFTYLFLQTFYRVVNNNHIDDGYQASMFATSILVSS